MGNEMRDAFKYMKVQGIISITLFPRGNIVGYIYERREPATSLDTGQGTCQEAR